MRYISDKDVFHKSYILCTTVIWLVVSTAMASLFLKKLETKVAIDEVIRNTKQKVVVMRFGRSGDIVCMQMDEIVS